MIKPFETGNVENKIIQNQAQEVTHWQSSINLQNAAAMEQIRTQGATERELIRTQGEIIRATERENIRLEGAQKRSLQREEEKERERAIFQEIQLGENGELRVVTKNLRVDSTPRQVANMTWPLLTVLRRARDISEKIFEVQCQVAAREQSIFLDAERVGSGTYLLKKFASIGVVFLNSTVSEKKLAIQLVALLFRVSRDEKLMPEMVGWMKKKEGTYVFVEEEKDTWAYAKKMSR